MVDKNETTPQLQFLPGDVYTLPYEDGKMHTTTIVCDACDGVNVVVLLDLETEQMLMPKQMIQEAANRARESGIELQIKTGQDIPKIENATSDEEIYEIVDSKVHKNSKKTLSRKERIIESLGNIGCIVIFLLVFCWLFFTCNKQKEEQRIQDQRQEFITDSIAHRRQYEKDSIDSVKNTPEYKAYQDSLHLAWEKKRKDEEKSTIVMVARGDSIYHFMTQCLKNTDLGRIRLMSEYSAKRAGLKECDDCISDRDEYIYFEDVIDYVMDGWSKREIIDMFDITRDDL